MQVSKLTDYTCKVTFDVSSNDRKSFLLISDLHWDNPKCDRVLLKKHLDQAKEKGAGILIFGDLFCAMQGKYDPRGSKESIRPEHNVNNYLDAIVEDAIKYFTPYKDNLAYISPGNHETSILKRLETDIIKRLGDGLGVATGAYSGWVIFNPRRAKNSFVFNMAYHHGYGGSSPVTKDVIQASRRAVYLPDAHVLVSGHVHERNIFPIMRAHLNSVTGKQVLREQLHLKLGTYKDEYTVGNGWAVEKGMPPKALGGMWLHFDISRGSNESTVIELKPELA